MTVERVPFSRMYGTLDEAKRVLDLRMDRLLHLLEIAEIVGSDAGQIRCLFKSISEEIATEVTIAEKTEWGVRDTELLLQSIWNEVAAAGIGIDEGPVRHIETGRVGTNGGIRQEWYLAGTSTEPVDRVQAERAIVRMYCVNVSPPRFVWCDSPMTAQLVLCILGRLPILSQDGVVEFAQARGTGRCGAALRPSPLGIWLWSCAASLRHMSGGRVVAPPSGMAASRSSDSLSNPARQTLLAAARRTRCGAL